VYPLAKYKAVFHHDIDVKIEFVASENAEWLVTLENHYQQWLVSKNINVKPCI